MGVRRADVVLDQQPSFVLGSCSAKTRVIELEGRCAVQPAHERLDTTASALRQMVDAGAGDVLDRRLRLQSVDGAVRVHDH